MRKKVAIAVAALLTSALILPAHNASARGNGRYRDCHACFGGYDYRRGYSYGRAFAYVRYGYRRGNGFYGGYAGSSCDLYVDCYN